MPSICFYFQVHQPYRIKKYTEELIGKDSRYFNGEKKDGLDNEEIFKKICKKCYNPATKLLLKLLKKHPEFSFTFSFSGTVLEQMEKFSPKTLESFRKLHDTGQVEILSETYYHSLAFFYSKKEFEKQVEMHRKKIKKIFNAKPIVFRNTELSYSNKLAKWAEDQGFKGILSEGWEEYLGQQSPNYLYRPKGTNEIKLLLRNYRFSDDIAFRFSEPSWSGWPLNAAKFAGWLTKKENLGDTINIFIDFETFGEHQWKETGIFHFLENLPKEIIKIPGGSFKTASQTVNSYEVQGELDIPDVLTWADTERDLSAWIGNSEQKKAIKSLYRLEKSMLNTKNQKLTKDWRILQTSDHFYYMSTKGMADGSIHSYFNPYNSPHEAYLYFTNTLKDLRARIKK